MNTKTTNYISIEEIILNKFPSRSPSELYSKSWKFLDARHQTLADEIATTFQPPISKTSTTGFLDIVDNVNRQLDELTLSLSGNPDREELLWKTCSIWRYTLRNWLRIIDTTIEYIQPFMEQESIENQAKDEAPIPFELSEIHSSYDNYLSETLVFENNLRHLSIASHYEQYSIPFLGMSFSSSKTLAEETKSIFLEASNTKKIQKALKIRINPWKYPVICIQEYQNWLEGKPLDSSRKEDKREAIIDNKSSYQTTKLMTYMYKAINEFWTNYDPLFPPKKEAIIAWLRQEFGISESAAKSIQMIIRPERYK